MGLISTALAPEGFFLLKNNSSEQDSAENFIPITIILLNHALRTFLIGYLSVFCNCTTHPLKQHLSNQTLVPTPSKRSHHTSICQQEDEISLII